MRRSYGAVTNSDGSPPPYSLPCIDGLNDHDDWTAVKDRVMKKRIQNRVAQRTYRQRVKVRMADLQAKLDSCEKKLRSREEDYQDGVEESPASSVQRRDSLRSSSSVESPAGTRAFPADGESSTTIDKAVQRGVEQQLLRFSNPALPDKQDSTITEETRQRFLPPALESVQGQEKLQSGKSGTDAQRTSLHFTNGQLDAFAVANEDNLKTYMSADDGSWESNNLTTLLQQESWTDSAQSGQQDGPPSISAPHNVNTSTPISCDDSLRLIDNSVSMNVDERVGSVIRYSGTMGFETFDDLVRTYYGQQFGETSFLCNEQRLSRNRRLPGVIASLFCATTEWTPWERRGFQEEILKATEAMLISESLEAHFDLQNRAKCALEVPRSPLFSLRSILSPLKTSITSNVSCPG
ncbi:hypothetical protein M3J09_002034 [Ascochyta lentis]